MRTVILRERSENRDFNGLRVLKINYGPLHQMFETCRRRTPRRCSAFSQSELKDKNIIKAYLYGSYHEPLQIVLRDFKRLSKKGRGA